MNRSLNVYEITEDGAKLIKTASVVYVSKKDEEKLINIIADINNSGKFIITAYGFDNVLTIDEFENVCKDLGVL